MWMFHAALQALSMVGLCFFLFFAACCISTAVGQECPTFTNLTVADSVIGTNLKVQLLLYTRRNKDCAEKLHEFNLTSTHLDLTKKVIMVIHGYRFTGSPPVWIYEIKDQLLEKGDINVIIVDWNRGATTIIYSNAVYNAKNVVEILKNFIDQMLANGLSLDSIYMIGVSLGAHIAGFVGKAYHGKIGRITGLDPAGPSFTGKSPSERLDHTDAQFVDVIHSDIDGTQYFKCDHQRSVFLYMASLKHNCHIYAYPCDSYEDFTNGKCVSCEAFHPLPCPILGYYADQWKNHLIEKKPPVTTAYFDTADKEPFCMYHYSVDIITWNKSNRNGFINIKIIDNAGNITESKIKSDAATFQQYKQTNILAGFYLDFHSVSKIALTFSTKNVIGPKYKLRVLQMRLKSMSDPERIQLCRYDFILLDNTETTFRPIPCLKTNM
ncbi:lipase member I isoform X2 [Varanus komodoensis]|uniref:lipase member I isoform X2 n=1 Tax=Varanus komodoensis TaxID=61221 RepID=UPI001CF7992E|nr:lipase member I isoform X2 [Varanus komodoensis]